MKIIYTVTDEVYEICDPVRISYGIDVYVSTKLNCTAVTVASVKDVTSDKTRLDALVQKCNDLQLSLVHLYDVLEDFIAN